MYIDPTNKSVTVFLNFLEFKIIMHKPDSCRGSKVIKTTFLLRKQFTIHLIFMKLGKHIYLDLYTQPN